jgi:hypothetical protein
MPGKRQWRFCVCAIINLRKALLKKGVLSTGGPEQKTQPLLVLYLPEIC